MERVSWAARILLIPGTAVFAVLAFLNTGVLLQAEAAVYLLYAVIIFLVIYFLAAKVRIKPVVFIIILFALSFMMKAWTAAYLKTEPISDFSLFWRAAKYMAAGQRDYLQWGYFNIWAYQTGIAACYAAVVKAFGASLLLLQYTNCIWAALTNVLIYLFARKISNDSAARAAALLYMLYPEPYFLVSTLSNQMLGDFLLFAAAYLFVRRSSTRYMLLSGALGAVANAVRPSGIIMLLAVVCTIWAGLFGGEDNASGSIAVIAQSAKHLLAVAAAYLLVGAVLSAAVRYSGLNPEGLKNNFPLYKFVVGLNQETSGGYSNEDEKLMDIRDKGQRNEAAVKLIRERLSVQPEKLANLFNVKLKKMWTDFDTLMWSFGRLEGGSVSLGSRQVPFELFSKCALRLEKAFYILVLFMAMLGCIACLKANRTSRAYLMVLSMFLVYFGLQMLIEIQTRYRYFALIAVFILAAGMFEIRVPAAKKSDL